LTWFNIIKVGRFGGKTHDLTNTHKNATKEDYARWSVYKKGLYHKDIGHSIINGPGGRLPYNIRRYKQHMRAARHYLDANRNLDLDYDMNAEEIKTDDNIRSLLSEKDETPSVA